jgi:hypothetical protein
MTDNRHWPKNCETEARNGLMEFCTDPIAYTCSSSKQGDSSPTYKLTHCNAVEKLRTQTKSHRNQKVCKPGYLWRDLREVG